MTLGRREFLAGAGALAVSARSALAAVQPAQARRDLPGLGARRLSVGRRSTPT